MQNVKNSVEILDDIEEWPEEVVNQASNELAIIIIVNSIIIIKILE